MTKKPDEISIDELKELSDEELEQMEIKQAGPEEKAALLDALKNHRVVFASGAEEDMSELGISIDDLIALITEDQKSNLN